MAAGTGIVPKTNFRTKPGTFRAGERAAHRQKVYRTRVRIARVVLLELRTLSSHPPPTREARVQALGLGLVVKGFFEYLTTRPVKKLGGSKLVIDIMSPVIP